MDDNILDFVARVIDRRAELQNAARTGYARALASMPLRPGVEPRIEVPAGMQDAIVAASLLRPQSWPALKLHYGQAMPAMLAAQLRKNGGPEERLFDTRLELARMPRLNEAWQRLRELASRHLPLGSLDGLTLGEVYTKCHFGRSMPMLYAYPGDLEAPFDDPLAHIDARYVGPLIHELAHFPSADPPAPANVHEALAAFIGSEAWPAQVQGGEDSLPGGAYFAAVGGWIARSLGIEGALEVQAGRLDLRDALGAPCAEALRIYGFKPFLETGAPHLLSDAFHPQRWWKLIDLHRDPLLAKELQRLENEPQRIWDEWLDSLPWQSLPAWRDAPNALDENLARRAEQALQVRAVRRGNTFFARRIETQIVLDKARCMLRSTGIGPDAVGAPPEICYPPALCH